VRDVAIKKIVSALESRGIDLSTMNALDFFAREGDWQTAYYAKKVSQIHAWEIDPKYEKNLRENLPLTAEIVIGDSFETLQKTHRKFDLIVLDNPQGCFGEKYCEHFDALPEVLRLLEDRSVVIFNIKTEPFEYSEKVQWQKRRNDFYERPADSLPEDFVFKFYDDFFERRGFEVTSSFWEERPQETGLYAFVAVLKRKDQ
jgi:hypothetical protein